MQIGQPVAAGRNPGFSVRAVSNRALATSSCPSMNAATPAPNGKVASAGRRLAARVNARSASPNLYFSIAAVPARARLGRVLRGARRGAAAKATSSRRAGERGSRSARVPGVVQDEHRGHWRKLLEFRASQAERCRGQVVRKSSSYFTRGTIGVSKLNPVAGSSATIFPERSP